VFVGPETLSRKLAQALNRFKSSCIPLSSLLELLCTL